MRTRLGSLLAVSIVGPLALALPGAASTGSSGPSKGPSVGRAVSFAVSPPASSVGGDAGRPEAGGPIRSRINPLGRIGMAPGERSTDPLAGSSVGPGTAPPLGLRFKGVGNPLGCNGCSPPDPNGDVGADHYVQMVNAT